VCVDADHEVNKPENLNKAISIYLPSKVETTNCVQVQFACSGWTHHAAAMTQLNIMIVTTVVNYTISTFHQSMQFRFCFVEFSHDIDVKFLIGDGIYPYSGYSRPNA
jgi:hypothetical protein